MEKDVRKEIDLLQTQITLLNRKTDMLVELHKTNNDLIKELEKLIKRLK